MTSRGVSMAGPCVAGGVVVSTAVSSPPAGPGEIDGAAATAGLAGLGCGSDEAWPSCTITHSRKTEPVMPPANVQRWERRADRVNDGCGLPARSEERRVGK